MTRNVSTCIVVAFFVGPLLAAIVANRLDPGLGTGLGIPLAIIAGLVLGAVATLGVALASRRWLDIRPRYAIVAVTGLLLMVLFPLADRGLMSVVR